MNDLLGFVICVLYVFSIIGVAELLRRRRGYGTGFTRKVIHIGVGMMSWGLPFLFDSPWPFVVAALGFAVLNFLDWRYGFFSAMASSDSNNLGTVYFPLAAATVSLLFWDNPPLLVAALMPLTWGDGIAPVIGGAFGRNAYTVFGHTRTLQGSAGFFVAGLLFTWLALWLIPGQPVISALAALGPAAAIMAGTTLVEAVSIRGLDNLTITAVAILILISWPF
ncbi:MAG: phosphatidate cytidylyltransferase [Anaerolineae bacterium]|nr:phosphatidate cytidylyltransferase [Anaerolineae bacterium]